MSDCVSFLMLSAGTGVRYQIHGDQCKGEHQRGECKFTLLLIGVANLQPCTFILLSLERAVRITDILSVTVKGNLIV